MLAIKIASKADRRECEKILKNISPIKLSVALKHFAMLTG